MSMRVIPMHRILQVTLQGREQSMEQSVRASCPRKCISHPHTCSRIMDHVPKWCGIRRVGAALVVDSRIRSEEGSETAPWRMPFFTRGAQFTLISEGKTPPNTGKCSFNGLWAIICLECDFKFHRQQSWRCRNRSEVRTQEDLRLFVIKCAN